MQLVTEEIRKQLPPLYATDGVELEEKTAVVKFFDPTGRGTWYGFEYDPTERRFFGWCVSPLGPDCDEMGYFTLDELEAIRGKMGLGIERDIHFQPKKMSEILKPVIDASALVPINGIYPELSEADGLHLGDRAEPVPDGATVFWVYTMYVQGVFGRNRKVKVEAVVLAEVEKAKPQPMLPELTPRLDAALVKLRMKGPHVVKIVRTEETVTPASEGRLGCRSFMMFKGVELLKEQRA